MAYKTTFSFIILQIYLRQNKTCKNSKTYKKNYSDNLILVYQFLSFKSTKKSKTNVNYGTPTQITMIE